LPDKIESPVIDTQSILTLVITKENSIDVPKMMQKDPSLTPVPSSTQENEKTLLESKKL
jgi:hypothetical protein